MATADVLKPDFASQGRHFIFTDEHEQLRESIHRFVVKELRPHAEEWEETTFPDWVFERMGELGFLGLDKPEQYGGQGGDYYTALVLAEEMAHAHCGGLAMGVAVQTDMAMPPILAFGTEEQKQQWAAPAIKGTRILCIGITEPDAGSDVAGIKTRAVRDEATGEYLINGSKTYITNGYRAHGIVLVTKTGVEGADSGSRMTSAARNEAAGRLERVPKERGSLMTSRPPDQASPDAERAARPRPSGTQARADAERAPHEGLTLFLVAMDTPGVIREKRLKKLGMHASDTALLAFQDVRVPESAVLGQVGKGFYHIMWELQGERLIGAAGAVAGAQRVFDRTLEYAKERKAFGRAIGHFQVIRHKFAEMATKIETARQMVYTTAWRFQNGEYPVREITMAKLYASRIAVEVADECIQVHGGAGYMQEYGIERSWRDLRLNRIGAGTDEIMLDVIGRSYGL